MTDSPQRIKIWYQVYETDRAWGFATINGVVSDFPDRRTIGLKLDDIRERFKGKRVIKICEQNLKK
jgi:hypothetical protein